MNETVILIILWGFIFIELAALAAWLIDRIADRSKKRYEQMLISRTCENCKFSQFKVAGDRDWIECLNQQVLWAMRISTRHVNGIFDSSDPTGLINEIDRYGRVQFVEKDFGCIYFELGKSVDVSAREDKRIPKRPVPKTK